MSRRGFGDVMEMIFAIFVLLLVYGLVFLLVPWLFTVSNENFTTEQMNAGDVFSLDSLFNTEVEVDNEKMLISELIYKAELDKSYIPVLEKEIKKIIDGFDFTFENWADYHEKSRSKVKLFVVGYALEINAGEDTVSIIGENFNEDYCMNKCEAIASYELYNGSRIRMYKSMGAA